MNRVERGRLVARFDAHVDPHRDPFAKQLRTIPLRAFGRVATVRLALLATRLRWDGSLTRKMAYGGRLRFPFPACWDLLVYRTYIDEAELRLLKFMALHLDDGDVMVDVGANIGLVCQFASQLVGPKGQVHAFEPGEQALGYLRANLAACPNCTIIPMAAMDRDGEVTFYEGIGAAMVSSSIVQSHAADRETGGMREVRVTGTRLDTHCANAGCAPALIKIDVEGAELSVLRGAARIIDQHHPAIVLEVSFRPAEYASQYAPCIALLVNAGYVPHVIDHDGGCHPITPDQVPARGSDCGTAQGYLHGLDNMLFLHPEGAMPPNPRPSTGPCR